MYQGRFAEALPLMTEELEASRRVMGSDHEDILVSIHNLGQLYRAMGKPKEAEPLLVEALEGRRRSVGADRPLTLSSMEALAGLYTSSRRYVDADRLYQELLESRRRVLGTEHTEVGRTLALIAVDRLMQSKYVEAESLLREALAIYENTHVYKWQRYDAQSMLAGSLQGQKQFDKAEPLALSGYEGMKDREAEITALSRNRLTEAGERVVSLYEAWGKDDKANEWRQKLRLAKTLPSAPNSSPR